MAKFKAGDKVWCDFYRPDIYIAGNYAGVVLGISEMLVQFESPFNFYDVNVFDVPPEKGTSCWHAQELYLSPRHEGYDGDKAGDWDSAPWHPERITVHEH